MPLSNTLLIAGIVKKDSDEDNIIQPCTDQKLKSRTDRRTGIEALSPSQIK